MALIKINKAISAAFEEQSLHVLNKFVDALKEKIEFDEDLEQFVNAFKTTLKDEFKLAEKATKKSKRSKGSDGASDSEAEPKKKRAPSAYNLFIKDKMAELKQTNPELKSKELMSAATVEWKKQKEATTTASE
jgi:hypothetical protein